LLKSVQHINLESDSMSDFQGWFWWNLLDGNHNTLEIRIRIHGVSRERVWKRFCKVKSFRKVPMHLYATDSNSSQFFFSRIVRVFMMPICPVNRQMVWDLLKHMSSIKILSRLLSEFFVEDLYSYAIILDVAASRDNKQSQQLQKE
jgi:hypothetical protein